MIAESYERIHRSNLVGMGVLPLQFMPGEGREALGLDGSEVFTIRGLADLHSGATVTVEARSEGGELKTFQAGSLRYRSRSGLLQQWRYFADGIVEYEAR